MSDDNIINMLDEEAAFDLLTGRKPLKPLYRDKLAERLGITPKERLSMSLVVKGEMCFISCLLDGGDLTPAQNEIFTAFLRESGAFTAVLDEVIPERPTTS